MSKTRSNTRKPFERVDQQNDANNNTRWNASRVESLRKQLAKFELDTNEDDRIFDWLCKTCYYIRLSGGVSLQAFHFNDCEFCGTEQTFANSDTRKVCLACAQQYSVCRNCMGDIDGIMRSDLVPPKSRKAATEFWRQQKELDDAHKAAKASRVRTSSLTSRHR